MINTYTNGETPATSKPTPKPGTTKPTPSKIDGWYSNDEDLKEGLEL